MGEILINKCIKKMYIDSVTSAAIYIYCYLHLFLLFTATCMKIQLKLPVYKV